MWEHAAIILHGCRADRARTGPLIPALVPDIFPETTAPVPFTTIGKNHLLKNSKSSGAFLTPELFLNSLIRIPLPRLSRPPEPCTGNIRRQVRAVADPQKAYQSSFGTPPAFGAGRSEPEDALLHERPLFPEKR